MVRRSDLCGPGDIPAARTQEELDERKAQHPALWFIAQHQCFPGDEMTWTRRGHWAVRNAAGKVLASGKTDGSVFAALEAFYADRLGYDYLRAFVGVKEYQVHRVDVQ
jgi:hypothetical protein